MIAGERRRYYQAAADFWLRAIHLQRERCQNDRDGDVLRADMDFYVVAVKRLREVASRARNYPRSDALREAIERFDSRWPKLQGVRNYAEHVRGPGGITPGGAWYFTDAIVGTGPGGRPEYLVDVRDTTESAEELHRVLTVFLANGQS